MTATVCTSIASNASDDFALKSSFYKIDCLSKAPRTSSCRATTPDRISMREILDTKSQKLGEDSYSSVLNLL
jgi:hypothetical protein